jgi:signal transduction histidine kinase
VVLVAEGSEAEVLAAEGFGRDDLPAILSAPRALDAERESPVFDVRGYRGLLRAAAPLDDGREVHLIALRRDRGGFENPRLVEALVRHVALAATPARVNRARAAIAGDAVTARMLGAADMPDLMGALGAELERAVGCARVGVFLWDERAALLQLAPGSFGVTEQATASIPHAAVDWASCAARVFATGHPYLANEAGSDPGVLREYVAHLGLRRLLSVPLAVDGRRVGVLQLADKPAPFSAADVDLAVALAPAIARALHCSRARFGLARRQRLEELISSVAVDIASGRSLQDFLGPVLDDMCGAIAASALALVPAAGDPVIWRRGESHEGLERILLADAGHASTMRAHVAGPRRPGGSGWAALHVPILMHGERAGTVSALRPRGEPFGREERRAVARLASLIALGWATERYQRERADAARMQERQQIGEELHDHTAQLLFAARLTLEALRERADLPPAAGKDLERAHDLITRSDAAVRELIDRSAQEQPGGLGERLGEVVGGVEDEFRRPVQLQISAPAAQAARSLTPHAENMLARVAREALVNAAKHAGPCQLAVHVTLTCRRRLMLSVTDDGIGTSGGGSSRGFGLASARRAVRRHGGSLRVHSGSAGGTRVAVSLPL